MTSVVSILCVVVALQTAPTLAAQSQDRPDADPRIQGLLASVSKERMQQLLTMLVGFGTRETLSSSTSPTRGIGAAREWIFNELKRSSSKLHVSVESYTIPPQGRMTRQTEVRNVIAILPGRTGRRVYVGGHYDSLNLGPGVSVNRNTIRPANVPAGPDPQSQPTFDHEADAPGANDDGSGTVLTMELARAFAESGIAFDATLVFACWAGEEQMDFGARPHAQDVKAAGTRIEGVLNDDIVGNSHGGNGVVDAGSVRVYSAGDQDSMSRSLARYIERVAAIYVPGHRVRLMAREDRFGRGSDHMSFRQLGFPAVTFRESSENLSRQHSADDTLDGVDFAYLLQNARVNAAAAASLALAPPAPRVTGDRNQILLSRDPSGYDASLRWNASAGATGYRVYWRDTWTNDWQHQQYVGDVTAFVFPNVSIDDYVFGVAAVGVDGAESLVSAYVAPLREDPDIKVIK
jgi:hypothetical protein